MSTETVDEVKERGIVVAPFTFEADHPRNDNLLIQAIPGCRLRSAIDGTKGHTDRQGEYRVPQDQSRALASFPKTRGMCLRVDPMNLSYEITDPLKGDEAMCERIRKFLNQAGFKTDKISGVDTIKGTLDKNRIKTLCREVTWLLDEKAGKIIQGPIPSMSDIEELPGDFLLNPGSVVPNTQPVFENQFPEWVDRLSRSGG